MKRVACIFFAFVIVSSVFCFLSVSAAGGNIVINSFRVAAEGKATDEYIELYNPGATTVSITGWRLTKKTASGTESNLVSVFPAAEIRAGESIIVGHADSTEKPQLYYTTTSVSLAQDNTITLYDPSKGVIDKVGYGKATDYEGKPIVEAGTDVWTRNKGADSNNNLNDFKRSAGSAKDYSGICLSELYPAPTDGEEWIELYNSEMTKEIGGLVIADKEGAVKKYVVPEGTVIAEGQYLIFKKSQTGITLNDGGDGAVIIDATGKVFDDTGASFGKAEKGSAYASDGKAWRWTETPTPGAKNRFSAADTTVSSVKKAALSTGSSATGSTKGNLPTGEVLGANTGDSMEELFAARDGSIAVSDRFFGMALAALATLGALIYTGYVNKEKLVVAYQSERKGYARTWRKIRERLSGR